MDNLTKAIEQMELYAKNSEEKKKTTTLSNRATKGELRREFQFYEQIHLKGP